MRMDYEPLGPVLTLKVKHGVDFRGKKITFTSFCGKYYGEHWYALQRLKNRKLIGDEYM